MARETSRGHAIGGGVVAGIVGGIVLAVFLVVANVATGQDVWAVLKGPAVPLLGDRALQPGFATVPVIVGVLGHFAVSIVWGVLFAILFYGASKGATVLLGAVWGIAVWLAMYYLVLPIVGLGEMARSAPLGMTILEHVLFGLSVGIAFLPYQRARLQRAPLGAVA